MVTVTDLPFAVRTVHRLPDSLTMTPRTPLVFTGFPVPAADPDLGAAEDEALTGAPAAGEPGAVDDAPTTLDGAPDALPPLRPAASAAPAPRPARTTTTPISSTDRFRRRNDGRSGGRCGDGVGYDGVGMVMTPTSHWSFKVVSGLRQDQVQKFRAHRVVGSSRRQVAMV